MLFSSGSAQQVSKGDLFSSSMVLFPKDLGENCCMYKLYNTAKTSQEIHA